MRLLFVVQQFRQGWGGAPESVRLMANQLQPDGIACDVFDNGRYHRDIGALSVLPAADQAAAAFDEQMLSGYDAIVIAGPWQRPAAIRRLLALRSPHQKLFYLPRGGLARAEFRRLRDLKKVPYFFVIERFFLRAADAVILSSKAELAFTMPFARGLAPAHVIPDFVNHPDFAPAAEKDGPVTIAFLAEISPRKGLKPLVDGFRSWRRVGVGGPAARLIVGGAVRPGSEKYLATARHAANATPADVEFLGAVPHGDRARFYAATDLMVVSSTFESYGLTVIEALAQGCALLSCPHVGALEYLGADLPVTIADGIDADAIANGLAQALPARRRSEADRQATRQAAAQTIERINAQARTAWAELLDRPRVATARRRAPSPLTAKDHANGE